MAQRENFNHNSQIDSDPGIGPLKILADLKDLTDVTLLSGAQKIPCHKMILAAASQYFRAMFRSEFRETVEKVVDLSASIKERALAKVVGFIYSQHPEMTWQSLETTFDVLEAAHFLQLSPLFNMCCKEIVENLDLVNSIRVLRLGILYENEYLKSRVLRFVKYNLKAWIELDHFWQIEAPYLKLLLAALKETMETPEFFISSVFEWIERKVPNPQEQQDIISLLNVKNLSEDYAPTFFKKIERSRVSREFLKSFLGSCPFTRQKNRPNVDPSSFKMLLSAKAANGRRGFQVVDFGGCHSAITNLPSCGFPIVGAGYKSSFYFLRKVSTETISLYEYCLLSGKIRVRNNMKTFPRGAIQWNTNKAIVAGHYLYVVGHTYGFRGTYLCSTFDRYDFSNESWRDVSDLIPANWKINSWVEFESVLLVVCRTGHSYYGLVKIYENHTDVQDLPLRQNNVLTRVYCFDDKLFMVLSSGLMAIHNMINNSMEIKFNSHAKGDLRFFRCFHSLPFAVKHLGINDDDEEEKEEDESMSLINVESRNKIANFKASNTQLTNWCIHEAFVLDNSI